MIKRHSSAARLQQQAPSVVTLREESSGKKRSDVNAKSMLKFDHLKCLAIWATAEASVPSLAAVFGHRLAATAQASGVHTDPSFFTCQRRESVLQPGDNCTVRVEKIKARAKPKHRCKKPRLSIENSVVYNCHFCAQRNLKRGTPQGYMEELCPLKAKFPSKSDLTTKSNSKFAAKSKVITANKDDDGMSKVDGIGIASQEITSKDLVHISPTTTLLTKLGTLLESNKRKRNRSGSSNRTRKSWTSLKDIAIEQDNHGSRTFTNLAIPFQFPYVMWDGTEWRVLKEILCLTSIDASSSMCPRESF